MAGRQSKRTPEREARLLEALRVGNTKRAACQYAGIDQSTLENWVHRDSDLSEAIKRAEIDAEVRMVAHIAKAASEGTWQAAAWWLERRRPADFGRRIELRAVAEQLSMNGSLAEAPRLGLNGTANGRSDAAEAG